MNLRIAGPGAGGALRRRRSLRGVGRGLLIRAILAGVFAMAFGVTDGAAVQGVDQAALAELAAADRLELRDDLLEAARVGDAEAVRALLRAGADASAARGDGITALHLAAEHGHAEAAGALLDAGAAVNAGTSFNASILARSSKHKRRAII